MLKKERCIIVGGSGTGKNFLERGLIKRGLKPCLKCTTRPKRKFEEQGITYNFISTEEFIIGIDSDKFLTYQRFLVTPENREPETWYYGVKKDDFNNSQVIIMTPGELSGLSKEFRKDSFVVYLNIDRKTREDRLFKREDKNDSIIRRLDSDEVDFSGFSDYDLKITDPEFSADDVYSLMT